MKYIKKKEDPNLYVMYKERFYILDFIGDTKFGYRAKLLFLDESKHFWVNGDLLLKGTHPINIDYVNKVFHKEQSISFLNRLFNIKKKSNKNREYININEYGDFDDSDYDTIYDLDPNIGDH